VKGAALNAAGSGMVGPPFLGHTDQRMSCATLNVHSLPGFRTTKLWQPGFDQHVQRPIRFSDLVAHGRAGIGDATIS
jgi:hypothetical protein